MPIVLLQDELLGEATISEVIGVGIGAGVGVGVGDATGALRSARAWER